MIDRFPLVLPNWLLDRQNRGAHTLAQQGLREAETKS
ncbi:MAG TPA: ribonuclease HI, partial [Lactobacillus sp.]|nr:ribonuclease HI [Lactobacillus sp.]